MASLLKKYSDNLINEQLQHAPLQVSIDQPITRQSFSLLREKVIDFLVGLSD
jgi:hypothetical protein